MSALATDVPGLWMEGYVLLGESPRCRGLEMERCCGFEKTRSSEAMWGEDRPDREGPEGPTREPGICLFTHGVGLCLPSHTGLTVCFPDVGSVCSSDGMDTAQRCMK